ncbi:uncharacterized protein C2845_PM01G11250 [Panicum miliaceum]|uniref:Uncharacterized protein n=1 Tax=Panicum miliaceum TaxID=4540 RepID=A0A3L6TG68_PANMI|nr:uncharacterized protein C2845_PM01G11250 [Panicum miliaceum]
MAVNWELQGCCGHNQRIFIAAVGVSTVVILLVSADLPVANAFADALSLLWRTFLLTPFKLITVFLHETSHALACKLTCGDGFGFIKDLEVLDELLGFVFLLLANLGSSFWGMIFILASTNLLTTRIAAGCFILALVVVLFVADNWFLRWLCIGFVVFIAVVWVIQEFTSSHILKYVILFIGVMNSLFSVYGKKQTAFSFLLHVRIIQDLLSVLINEMFLNYLDIYDDLISRRVHSSDAEKFAEICPCPCNGVGWGVIWISTSCCFDLTTNSGWLLLSSHYSRYWFKLTLFW